MKYLRVVDQVGNKQDFETEHIPRIGERIELWFGRGNDPVRQHFYRVKDVSYNFENSPEHQVAVLTEEIEENDWPS